MAKRKSDGIAARLGSLFGKKKPVHHAVPHIYVSTESDHKKRKAKAKERAAKRKAALEAAAPSASVEPSVPAADTSGAKRAPGKGIAKGIGKIFMAKASVDVTPSSDEVASLKDEEGFMQKVALNRADTAPRTGVGLWTMVRDRFGVGAAPATTKASTEKVDDAAPAETVDPTKDSFLLRATAAPTEPRVRTESTELPQAPRAEQESSLPSALDEAVAGAQVSPPKSIPAKTASPRASTEAEGSAKPSGEDVAKKENADIKAQPEAPKPAAEPAKKKVHVAQFQSKKGFKSFLTSLNYIGMGKERMMFIQNMSTMLNAGLPLTDSLKTLTLETRNKPMRKLLGRIIDAVENGSPLWRAMEAQDFFSLHALALVRIGEEAGSLAENMGYLAVQDEKDHALRSKVKMAMIYPTIVMVIMFIIVVGLGMFVLPNLVGVLFSLNVKLPLVTRIVIWCSDAFVAYGPVGVPSFIAAFILLAILSKYTSLRVVTQWVMFKIPGIGRLAREATIARFGVILGGLMKAGVPVVEALESLVQVTPIASYKKLYSQLLARITIGDSFQKSFATIKGSEKLLPPSVQQLVITGEKSGSLAEIMLKVADIYDKKATETAEKLPIILEPMLLLFIGGLVGSIAFAIIVPIYSIVGNVGNT